MRNFREAIKIVAICLVIAAIVGLTVSLFKGKIDDEEIPSENESVSFEEETTGKEDICFGSHNVAATATPTDDGNVTYDYFCSDCGIKVAESRTVPADLAYIDGTLIAKAASGVAVCDNRVEDGVVYKHIESSMAIGVGAYAEAKITGVDIGKYVAIKYRVTDAAYGGGVKFEYRFKNNSPIHSGLIQDAFTGDWVVAVIDISNKEQYRAQADAGLFENNQFWFRVQNGATVDVAYVVMSDDMNVITSFLEEGEPYYDRGDGLQNVPGTEIYVTEEATSEIVTDAQ